MLNLKAAEQAAKQRERQQALIQALREMAQPLPPRAPDWGAEREAQAQRAGGPVRAGWATHHEPERRRFLTFGTLDGIEVAGPFVTDYDTGPCLSDAVEDAINAVRRLSGESFSDVVLAPDNRRWIGPMG